MIFSLIVYSSPGHISSGTGPSSAPHAGGLTALRFAQTLLEQGHELYRVFFYGDGVYHASLPAAARTKRIATPPPAHTGRQWSELGQLHQLDLVVCVTAALQRGLITAEESKDPTQAGRQLLAGFQISGLGQLTDAALHSDRTITFR